MKEQLSLNEARHILSDFFEIHTEAPQKSALTRAIQLLDEIESNGKGNMSFGSLPTMRVGEAVVSYLPEDYDPAHIYLLHREPRSKKGYTRKIRVK